MSTLRQNALQLLVRIASECAIPLGQLIAHKLTDEERSGEYRALFNALERFISAF